jgi:hypothetical protein
MELHRLFVDGRLERVIAIGKRGEFEGHWGVSIRGRRDNERERDEFTARETIRRIRFVSCDKRFSRDYASLN